MFVLKENAIFEVISSKMSHSPFSLGSYHNRKNIKEKKMVRSSFLEILPQVLAVSVKNIVLIGKKIVL